MNTGPTSRTAGVLLASLLLAAGAGSVCAQEGATPSEARFNASKAMSRGAFAEAITSLQQLVDWYGSSRKDTTVIQMEMVYFNLGACHFLLGQFSESRACLLYTSPSPRDS